MRLLLAAAIGGVAVGYMTARRRIALSPSPAVPPSAPTTGNEPANEQQDRNVHRGDHFSRALLFGGLALLMLGAGLHVLPEDPGALPETPDYKIYVLCDHPNAVGKVILDLSRVDDRHRPGQGEIAVAFQESAEHSLPDGVAVNQIPADDQPIRVLIAAAKLSGSDLSPQVPIFGHSPPQNLGVLAITPVSTKQELVLGASSLDTSQVRAAEGNGTVASVPVTLPESTYEATGSRISFTPPRVEIGAWTSADSYRAYMGGNELNVPSDHTLWFPPTGTVIVLGPDPLSNYRPEVASPPEQSPHVWQELTTLTAHWLGTDPARDQSDQRSTFLAGLILGIAGAALIAAIQEIRPSRIWRRRPPPGRR